MPGTAIRSIHATANFGILISASRLPASESSERHFELEASSSTSPRRGSMTGFNNFSKAPAAVLTYRARQI